MSKLTAKVEGFIFTARKRSLGQGNIFTPVCHSVHGGVSQHALQVVSQHALQQGVCAIPGCLAAGGYAVCSRGGVPGGPPRTATAAGGTHPTGMHSCVQIKLHA